MAKHFFENSAFHYLMAVAIIVTMAFSIMSFYSIQKIKKVVAPEPLDVEKLTKKLNLHSEMKDYQTTAPMNVVEITQANFPQIQSQLQDVDSTYLGSYIVQYQDQIVLYDYKNDVVKKVINLGPQFPADLLTKLTKHKEMAAFKDQKPVNGGQLDEMTLNSLKQQSPDLYKNAKIGDYVVVFQDTIVIYDYAKDRIINSTKIQ